MNGKELSLSAEAMATNNGTVYYKVNNLVSTIELGLKTVNMSLNSTAIGYLSKIDGKWAKYAISDLEKRDNASAKEVKCVLDVYKKYGKVNAAHKEVAKAYENHQFITIAKDVKSKDGNYGYDVSVDDSKLDEFTTAAKNTTIGKALDACSISSSGVNSKAESTTSDDTTTI